MSSGLRSHAAASSRRRSGADRQARGFWNTAIARPRIVAREEDVVAGTNSYTAAARPRALKPVDHQRGKSIRPTP